MPPITLNKRYQYNPDTDLLGEGGLGAVYLLKRSVFGRRSTKQTQGEITDNVLNKPLPTTEIQKLPAPFKQIITACLVRHATNRIQSADALLTLINQKQGTIKVDDIPPKPEDKDKWIIIDFSALQHTLIPQAIQQKIPKAKVIQDIETTLIADGGFEIVAAVKIAEDMYTKTIKK